ncbi:hypothetical protein TWF696_000023 [Orbilia brochopaga]|uniref:Uncharacterized protein n=1 Tax=Orbilia brochopaga TaxID=3140254 RepID=A0AAV9VBC1_9PEZI
MISQAVEVHSAKTSVDAHELDSMRTTGAAIAVPVENEDQDAREPVVIAEVLHLAKFILEIEESVKN